MNNCPICARYETYLSVICDFIEHIEYDKLFCQQLENSFPSYPNFSDSGSGSGSGSGGIRSESENKNKVTYISCLEDQLIHRHTKAMNEFNHHLDTFHPIVEIEILDTYINQ